MRSILDGPGSRFIPIHRPECVGCYKPLLPRALTETVRRSGTAKLLSRLAGAVARAVGGARPGQDRARPRPRVCPGWDAAADVAVLRAQPGVFGLVASDPTVSRLIARLATDADAALATLAGARAAVQDRVWGLAEARVQDGQLVLDLGRDRAYRALGETRHDADLAGGPSGATPCSG